VMERLAKGPLTMDRVLAVLASEETQAEAGLALNATTLPFLGRFLQDLGLETDQVKEIISNFKPGQKFGAEILRDILLKHGRTNLKGMTLSGVNMENLQEMLVSLGINDKDLKNFQGKFKATNGKMSMEGFLAFLKSVDRPRRLTADQVKNISRIIENMTLNNSLQSRLYFDRTVALLQSMGDQEMDSKFISSNPAIQALRGGADSAQAVMRGTGALGQNQPGREDGGREALAGLANKAGGEIISSRPAQTGLPSRLSESVLKQIAEKMVYQARHNQHQLRINLNPPKLGWVNMHLVMKGSGLHASIIAENAMVRDALEGHMTQLRDNLAQQGLNLERFDVSLGQDRNQAGTGDRKRRFGGFNEKKASDLDQAHKIEHLTPDGLSGPGLVDILA
ncbi:MAG: flagellar hook-length control protein FliK, partial [Thermodesulfobacteriota bacterium]|nr:flagellar hook-length control protein FliK [Thermodesulfobacteriota bacterium]